MGFFGGGGSAASNMGGATSSTAGTAGLVPAPAAGEEHLMLKGGGSFGWIYPQSTAFNGSSDYIGAEVPDLVGAPSSTLLNTRLYLSVIVMSGSKTFNRIGFRFGSAASCDARIGLYECSTTEFKPTTNIIASTALSGSVNTNVEFTISPSITLKNKIYFACLIPSLSTSMIAAGTYNMLINSYLGAGYNSSVSPINSRLYVDFNYAALPSDLSSYSLKYDFANFPIVYLRNV